jgi:hypothetical protein
VHRRDESDDAACQLLQGGISLSVDESADSTYSGTPGDSRPGALSFP